jgi:hypothetical protein
MKSATKDDWKTTPMPNENLILPISKSSFSKEEYEKIKIGFIPGCMEDKWFMYCESNSLYVHRSWTGVAVYKVIFINTIDKYKIRQILFNMEVYNSEHVVDLDYEIDLVLFLINQKLLNRKANFPIDSNVKIENKIDYIMHRHGIGG